MDKAIWNSTKEWSYFLGNILVEDCPLVLSPLKYKGVGAIFEPKKKKKIPNRGSLLNNNVDKVIWKLTGE